MNLRDGVRIGKEKNEVQAWSEFHNVDISNYTGEQRKDKILRNLVDYEAGKIIYDAAKGIHKANNTNQTTLEL